VRDIRFIDNKFSTNVHPHTSASNSRCVGIWGTWFYRGRWPSYYGGPTDLWNRRGSLRSGNVVIETGENIDRGGPAGCEGANSSPPAPTCQGRRITDWLPPFKGGAGQDVILGTSARDIIKSGPGDDLVCAGGGDDAINGGSGNDRIRAGQGDDILFGGPGNDVYDGEQGSDTLSFAAAAAPITAALGVAGAQNTGEGRDTLMSIENAIGSVAGDRLTGSSASNRLDGRGGGDVLLGMDGADTLLGRDGSDTLGGGPGAGDKCHGDSGSDSFQGGSRPASGCETVTGIP
jgi:Ca2+-binding RTX toxin-like protein